jgi:hypothetical protein
LALTPELYARGYAAFKEVTCIPDNAFESSNQDVTITGGLANLKTVGTDAFYYGTGKLTFAGAYPQLVSVGSYAFFQAGTAASLVDLDLAFSLQTLGFWAFDSYKGRVSMRGPYPQLVSVGIFAFKSANNAASIVAIQCRGSTWSMYGARFPTEIYTRGCHWIPRMFA